MRRLQRKSASWRVAALLQDLGGEWTHTDLAERLGLPIDTVRRATWRLRRYGLVEAGPPGVNNVLAFSTATDVSPMLEGYTNKYRCRAGERRG